MIQFHYDRQTNYRYFDSDARDTTYALELKDSVDDVLQKILPTSTEKTIKINLGKTVRNPKDQYVKIIAREQAIAKIDEKEFTIINSSYNALNGLIEVTVSDKELDITLGLRVGRPSIHVNAITDHEEEDDEDFSYENIDAVDISPASISHDHVE